MSYDAIEFCLHLDIIRMVYCNETCGHVVTSGRSNRLFAGPGMLELEICLP